MKSKKIYIILFIVLYLFVALVSGIHGFAFFGLANVPLLAIMLAIAFEVGQAAVLFSILTDSSQRKKVMPWLLMGIFTLVQIMGNVYNSYKYLITNAEENLRFFKEPIFIWTQLPDAQANVILSYVQGAILPICGLLLTSMVAGFLNKKDEPEEIEYVEEDEEPIEEEQEVEEDTPSKEALKKFEEIKKEREEKEPKITIDKENGIIDLNTNHTPSHKDYYIPPKTEVEEIKGTDTDGGVIGKEGVDGMKILKETEEKPVEEHEDKEKSHFVNM